MSLIEMLQGAVLVFLIVVTPGVICMALFIPPLLAAYLWLGFRSLFVGTQKASRDCGYRDQGQTRTEQTSTHGPRDRQKTVPPKPRPPDPFQAACTLLGLAVPHDEPAFRAAYRSAIMRTHPDLGGSTVAAQRVNAAADLIRRRNGWA